MCSLQPGHFVLGREVVSHLGKRNLPDLIESITARFDLQMFVSVQIMTWPWKWSIQTPWPWSDQIWHQTFGNLKQLFHLVPILLKILPPLCHADFHIGGYDHKVFIVKFCCSHSLWNCIIAQCTLEKINVQFQINLAQLDHMKLPFPQCGTQRCHASEEASNVGKESAKSTCAHNVSCPCMPRSPEQAGAPLDRQSSWSPPLETCTKELPALCVHLGESDDPFVRVKNLLPPAESWILWLGPKTIQTRSSQPQLLDQE